MRRLLRLPRPPLPIRTVPPSFRISNLFLRAPASSKSNPIAPDAPSESRLLQRLIEPCEDITSAKNELRWLTEHVRKTTPGDGEAQNKVLERLVDERATGKPLQYILGTEYFGDLELECRPGVLIPRQETATSISHLVDLLSMAPKLPQKLRVLDLCTGSGCIPLLFQHLLAQLRPDVQVRLLGVDISSEAIELARDNKTRLRENIDLQIREWEKNKKRYLNSGRKCDVPRPSTDALDKTAFVLADVLADDRKGTRRTEPSVRSLQQALELRQTATGYKSEPKQPMRQSPKHWQVLICNPPYISPDDFLRTTSRSVREFEPELALVPPSSSAVSSTDQGDLFYPRLLEIANQVRAKVVVFEVADMAQGLRVAHMAKNFHPRTKHCDYTTWEVIEIWRDQPGQASATGAQEIIDGFRVIGHGNGRSVVCWRRGTRVWYGSQEMHAKQFARIRAKRDT